MSKSCRVIQDDVEERDDLSFVTALTTQDAGGQITDTFERGDPIQLVMTVRNELTTNAVVQFPTALQSDFVIVEAGTSEVVWQWSEGQTFAQGRSELQFLPEQTRTFTQTWDQINRLGVRVRPGTYEARGVLVFSDFNSDVLAENQQGSDLERFTITD